MALTSDHMMAAAFSQIAVHQPQMHGTPGQVFATRQSRNQIKPTTETRRHEENNFKVKSTTTEGTEKKTEDTKVDLRNFWSWCGPYRCLAISAK